MSNTFDGRPAGQTLLTPNTVRRDMAPKAIISYDGTSGDQDALMLGRVLAACGADLELAYVRHAVETERVREELEEHQAQRLLEHGARALGDLAVERRVVISGSTPEGLRRLSHERAADIVVFGSDYRTAAGHIAPQRSAQTLLDGGSTALAIAPAGYLSTDSSKFGRIRVLAGPQDQDALATARDLATCLRARLTWDEPYVDFLVIASWPEAPPGRVLLTSQGQDELESATCPVLVLPREARIRFSPSVRMWVS